MINRASRNQRTCCLLSRIELRMANAGTVSSSSVVTLYNEKRERRGEKRRGEERRGEERRGEERRGEERRGEERRGEEETVVEEKQMETERKVEERCTRGAKKSCRRRRNYFEDFLNKAHFHMNQYICI